MKPISPSEIQTYRECPRKWGYEYFGRLRPEKVGAGLGGLVHSVLENYLETGAPFDTETTVQVLNKDGSHREVSPGAIAQAGVSLLPKPPVPRSSLETKLDFEDDGILFHGRADLVLQGPGPWIVYDHKTTSDFRYMKTKEDLAKDPQALLYSRWACLKSGLDDLDLVWIYYRTRGAPAARRVRLRVLQSETREEWEKVKSDARTIRALTEPLAGDVPQNFFACQAFGGCPHRQYCHGEMFMDPKTPFARHLATLQQGLNPPPPPPPLAAPPPPLTTPPPPLTTRPPIPPEAVTFVPDLRAMGREEMKALAVSLGLLTPASKAREESIRDLLIQHYTGTAVQPQLGAPETSAFAEALMATPAPARGFALYVDCMPVAGTGERVVLYSQWSLPVLAKAAEISGQPDYRMADYGKGPGIFRAALTAYLPSQDMSGVALVVSSAGNSDAIAVLEGAASAVIRSIR